MLSLTVLFWMYVILFAAIGMMRGWAKELLVTFSLILAIFIIVVLDKVPQINQSVFGTNEFWLRFAIVAILVFFGYQSPNLPKLAGSVRFARERLQDMLLGAVLGAANGYFIAGSLWYYLAEANYPFTNVISMPDPTTPIGMAIANMVNFMPPAWLATGQPVQLIFFAVALSFVCVIVVFI
jgi:hypothetical protein